MDNKRKIKVCPSILSADFRILKEEVRAVEQAGADMIHCDIMDGRFVPNISFGPAIVEAVKKSVSIPLDVHLMIQKPAEYLKDFYNAGADIITVHAEAVTNISEIIDEIKSYGIKTGVTVNPDKNIGLFLPFLDRIDQVLIMSVYAGFGGQKFIPDVLDKIAGVKKEADRLNLSTEIEVDGGINGKTAEMCSRKGASVFVAGSYIFASDDYQIKINSVRNSAKKGRK